MKSTGTNYLSLVVHRGTWQRQLTNLLGIAVRDIYLADDPVSTAYAAVRDHGLLIFDREAGPVFDREAGQA